MASICLYFQVHQPHRLKWFWPENGKGQKRELFDVYFDRPLNKYTFEKVAKKCYHPTNKIILELIDQLKGQKKKFKLSYSLSGTFMEQCEEWDKDVLEEFKQMADSKCVEFLGETYYHSLSSLFEDRTEFIEEVNEHRKAMKDLLGVKPNVFRNTELLYHDDIAREVEKLGFRAIMTEGIERILEGWKSPNYIYKPRNSNLKILLRNYKLSDDIGYRFSSRWWNQWPLTAGKYAAWLSATPGDTINIFMDYETFGEHQWEDTGIFWFLKSLPYEILKHENLEFATPSEVISRYESIGEIRVPWYETVSWADMERDASAWLGNHMQQICFSEVKSMEKIVKKSRNPEFLRIWKCLLTGDHFYYMCTKGWGDGDVHCYFSHHGTPYDAAVNYMAIIADFKEKVLNSMCNVTIKGKK